MAQVPRAVSPIRGWLTEFLFVRDVFREPPGFPLYRYQVTPGEYRELEQILRDHRTHATHPTYGLSWAAAFCLFVAESFRREYDAKDGGWAWARFENRLDCKFTPQQHGELVRQGLISTGNAQSDNTRMAGITFLARCSWRADSHGR